MVLKEEGVKQLKTVGDILNSEDVLKWLDEPGSLSKCLGLADQIIDEIHDAMYQD